jgi:prepilin-type N-terminal cleavage/methylation domain-containing protein
VASGQCSVLRAPYSAVPLSPFRLPPSRCGFTLLELLTVITIIGILSMMVFGAFQTAREAGKEAATKATIAKLHTIIMDRYESYMHRRVPLNLSGLSASAAAKDRLYAIRDLMRMEMPDRVEDFSGDPIKLPNSGASIPKPALAQLYSNYHSSHPPGSSAAGKECAQAEMLYLIVSLGCPEAMDQFSQSEIGDTDGNGWLEFLDGWGRPIFFLRWAPGFSQYSDIQKADPTNHHDPFDPRRVDSAAYQLIPLIYSAGHDGKYGLDIQSGFKFSDTGGDIFGDTNFPTIGKPKADTDGTDKDFHDNITNHHIEAR